LVPFSSVSEHHAVLEFKAVDSELEEKISLPLNEWQLEWIAGYYERNSELLRLACIELVESLDNANERKL
jgi:hypothetical protein